MRRSDHDEDWLDIRRQWSLRGDTTYLNHGSFGPPPQVVTAAREKWRRELDCQPMDFFVRRFEPAWKQARESVARFVQAPADCLVFLENSTAAMNEVAASFPLAAGDEVLLNDHEYGAVQRIWRRRCESSQATARIAQLPPVFESTAAIVDALFAQASPKTRLIVVSHITSPTAIVMPIRDICRRAQAQGIAVCVDGPHAVAQLPLNIGELACDFFTASCHKWLSAPFGSGFLYVAPKWHAHMRPTRMSWGRIPPTEIRSWSDEYIWSGTRDPSAYLAVPAAISFLQQIGFDTFRRRAEWLAGYARQQLAQFGGGRALADGDDWYAAMAHVPLPAGDARGLQAQLWQQFGIEVPVVEFSQRRFVRVSCHLYNQQSDIDRLVSALQQLLRG